MTEPSFHEDSPEARRRKIRKGTQSCWECKRRKVRCIFSSRSNAVCDNCRRRGTTCISQEYPDRPVPSASSNQVEARLGRVEELIEQLVSNSGIVHTLCSSPTEDCSETRQISGVLGDREESGLKTASSTSNPEVRVSPEKAAGKYDELARDLLAVWPSQSDLDIICTLPVGLSAHMHCGLCTPYFRYIGRDPPPPREILQLPPPGSHPVLIARKLLVLGAFLQGVPPSSVQEMGELRASYRNLMSRVVDKAIMLVNTNDDLTGSVEGIECIMMEAIYQNYAGNLHRAWMAVQRATAVAQVMALHRGVNSPFLKILEPETRAAFNPDQICFRLAEMDRYLSLMLGLPQSSLEARFANPKALDGCHPMDRMQRIHCIVSGRILQRNDTDVIDLAKSHDIDKLLQKAAAEMPPQWWLVPNFGTGNSNGAELLRLMDQFTHYHLLLRLHLPYMLRHSSARGHDNSKITAVQASREILSRYVAFRISNPVHYYCRGIDFLAFVATTVICVAHIDSRNQGQHLAENPNPGTAFDFLAHSRPSDRGLMERTLEIVESMARAGTDAIASKLTRTLNNLLSIETNVSNGAIYSTSSSRDDEGELECDGKLTNGGKALHIHIPYFGTINFERGGAVISKSTLTAPIQALNPDQLVEQNHEPPSSDCPPAYQIGDQSVYTNSNTMPYQLPSPQFHSSNEVQLPYPVEHSGAEDDLSLQGVDVALFDSLFGGMEVPDMLDDEAWAQWTGMPDRDKD